MEQLPSLRLTALDARQRFELVLRFFAGRGRRGTKVGCHRCVVFLQRTLWTLERHRFEPLYSPLEIELEIVAQRVLRNVHYLRTLSMRQSVTLQP